jgi:hypothetical protein
MTETLERLLPAEKRLPHAVHQRALHVENQCGGGEVVALASRAASPGLPNGASTLSPSA